MLEEHRNPICCVALLQSRIVLIVFFWLCKPQYPSLTKLFFFFYRVVSAVRSPPVISFSPLIEGKCLFILLFILNQCPILKKWDDLVRVYYKTVCGFVLLLADVDKWSRQTCVMRWHGDTLQQVPLVKMRWNATVTLDSPTGIQLWTVPAAITSAVFEMAGCTVRGDLHCPYL